MRYHPASLLERAAYHESGHVLAALAFDIPIIAVTIAHSRPAMHRATYHPPTPDLGLRNMVTLCLAGPAAEECFCGPITDDSANTDYRMARHYLARHADPRIGVLLVQHKEAADKLVRTPWARDRIRQIAAALLRHGTLTGDQIGDLAVLRHKMMPLGATDE